jgi:ABC-type nitrate/sulfonate/bicarbonate transport system permease component
MFSNVFSSLQLLFQGYIPAIILGTLLGCLIGFKSQIYQILKRVLQIPYHIAPIAFFPVTLIVFKNNQRAAALAVMLSAIWPIIIYVAAGLQQFRQNPHKFRLAIHLIFDALKLGIWVAWFAVISVEMISGIRGLGFALWESANNGNLGNIIQGILYIGIIGFLLNQLLDLTENLVVKRIMAEKKTEEKSF